MLLAISDKQLISLFWCVFQYWTFLPVFRWTNSCPSVGLKPLCFPLVGPSASPCTACSSCSPTPSVFLAASPLARTSTSSPSSPSPPSPSSRREPCRCCSAGVPATDLAPPGGRPGNLRISGKLRIGQHIIQRRGNNRKSFLSWDGICQGDSLIVQFNWKCGGRIARRKKS